MVLYNENLYFYYYYNYWFRIIYYLYLLLLYGTWAKAHGFGRHLGLDCFIIGVVKISLIFFFELDVDIWDKNGGSDEGNCPFGDDKFSLLYPVASANERIEIVDVEFL